MAKGLDEFYEGTERLILGGQELPYTILDFWRLNLSQILLNMTRGAFAEFVVQAAMTEGGFDAMHQLKNGVEPWDIDGPEIFTKDGIRSSRIEVKSTASIQLNTPDYKEPISLPSSRLTFSIRPAIDWDVPEEPARRHSDIYVFCHYTAERKTDNMLDLKWWDFYVYPTFKIDNDIEAKISKQKTISIRRLQMIGVEKKSFNELYANIRECLDEVSSYYKQGDWL